MKDTKLKTEQRNNSVGLDSKLSDDPAPLTKNPEPINESKPTVEDGEENHDRTFYLDSIAATLAGLEQGSLLREMQKAYFHHLTFLMGPSGGKLELEEAVKRAIHLPPGSTLEQEIERMVSMPVSMISWESLSVVWGHSHEKAKTIWENVKFEARAEFESGHRAAEVFEPVHWLRDLWNRARYLAIRDSFIDDWQPQGGIELAMIDMLTQTFHLYLHWTEQSVLRAQTEMSTEPSLWIQDRAARDHSYPRRRENGYWDPPTVSEQEATDHAAQMAERYSRAFQRTLRAMRDLRRYSMPVTINNPGQVNIAGDGGQQVNTLKRDR